MIRQQGVIRGIRERAGAGQAEPPITSSVSTISPAGHRFPVSMSSVRPTMSLRAISATGMRTVVRLGITVLANTPPSNPVTAKSVPTSRPAACATLTGGSWYLTTFQSLEGVTVKTAPSVVGPKGTRAALSGSNADSIWVGSKVKDAAWQWVSYMGTEDCQSLAGADGTFFPSIKASMDASVTALAADDVDLSAFTVQLDDGTLYESPLFSGGTEVESTVGPMAESFWTGERDDDVFQEMDDASAAIFADNN